MKVGRFLKSFTGWQSLWAWGANE